MSNYVKKSDVKVLAFSQPQLLSFADTSNLLGIIQVVPHSQEWINNFFIQLYGFESQNEKTTIVSFMEMRFDECPFTKDRYQNIDLNFALTQVASIHDLLTSAISHDYYIKIFIDRKYFSYFNISNSYIHDIFIYGYDLKREVYYITDFDNRGRFFQGEISFKEIELGCLNKNSEGLMGAIEFSWINEILMITITEKKYQFNLTTFKIQIADYYHSTDTMSGYLKKENLQKKNAVFGLSNYDLISDFIDKMEDNSFHSNVRPFQIMWQHKRAMINKVEYLHQQGIIRNTRELLATYRKLENDWLIMRNLFIKFKVSENKTNLDKIRKIHKGAKEKEKTCIEHIMEEIERKS